MQDTGIAPVWDIEYHCADHEDHQCTLTVTKKHQSLAVDGFSLDVERVNTEIMSSRDIIAILEH